MKNKIVSYGKHNIDNSDIKEVVKVLKSNSITQGSIVETFANKVAKFCGAKYAIAVSSGTAALHLALQSLDLKSEDEVITTPMTFCATANAVLYCGADIKLVDIDEKTLNIDINKIEQKINKRTKAIIPVDFRGYPADLYQISKIAKRYNLKVIEDASHSLGSKYLVGRRQFKCGDCAHSDLSTFSFHPVKHITTGEGGVITTNDFKLFNKLELLKKHGIKREANMFSRKKRIGSWKYDMFDLGFNYRLTNFQAALGLSQMKKLEFFIKRRREIVNYYNSVLGNIDQFIIPYESSNTNSNFHLYTLQIKKNNFFDRYDLYNYLLSKSYNAMVHYIPIHYLSYYKKKYKFKIGDFPISEKYYNRAISIPLYPSLSDKQVERVVLNLKNFLKLYV